MDKNLDIRDLSVVVAVRDHNPNMLTPDFLKGSGVVPTDWELARPPVLSSRTTKIVFKNGIKIEAKPGIITFSEGLIEPKTPHEIEITKLASKYTAALPNLDYRAVGINPRRFKTFGDHTQAAHRYLTEKILSPGVWQEVGETPIQAGINLVYTINGVPLRLSINEAKLQIPEKEAISAILFSGNFHHDLVGENGNDRLSALQNQLENWLKDWDSFQDILVNKFLDQNHLDSIMAA
ncbi:hypothetical protein Xen7305DRAFT_00027370 [Xenococcus sp. PCC 7305]|uniref:hypothetical protein n=1 Tax=Xenococcus sp. PCC 7305 TaxID=102125 RepID=UPI0002ACD231|nr:hypothetical protein [Xenococcus sp. PCC 7305]ELS03019.1 hypothetical protein Xen7305DRAFT_00027370 [Xenococcus sp. PCC 7305]